MKSKFKKVISTCLAIILLLGTAVIAPLTATAAQTQAVSTGETSGDFEYYDYGDGTAEITGYTGSATELTIPSELDGKKVTSIGDTAFFYCTSLTSVTIPNSVTEIGYRAFFHCTSLANIYVDSKNESYAEIDGVLFDKEVKTLICYPAGKNSSSYSIPDSVTSIGNYAFSDCRSLESITIPDSVTSIAERTFSACTSLESITIPNSVTEISYGAFEDCTSLASITIPNSVTSIGDTAFFYCTSLTSVTIPNSVTEIGYRAFFDCTSLANIYVDSKNESYAEIDGVLFDKEVKTLICYPAGKNSSSYSIPDSVTSIGDSAFSNCTSLTSITIPNSVTSIGDSAFSNCTSLTSITIPNGVTEIGYWAFCDCTSLESITIPDSVTEIGSGAFSNTAWYDNQLDGVVYAGKVLYTYKGEMPQNTTITVKDGTKGIGDIAFVGCTNLTSITIPDSVTEICGSAFYNCTSLKSITIPASVKYIGDFAFGYYPGEYNEIKIDGFKISGYSGTEAETYANDNGFEFISLGDLPAEFCLEYELTDNGEIVITDYTGSATELTIPSEIDGKKVTSIGDSAFCFCTSLASITIPNSVTSIGNAAFAGCTSLKSITIPDSVTSIAERTFSACTSLASITIPNSVTEISYGAFEDCTSLASITIPDSVTSIADTAFFYCTSLTSVTIPNSVTEIGYRAFFDCTSLANIYVDSKNESYAEIDGVLFDKEVKTLICYPIGKKSSSYSIPDSVTSIGYYAFSGCSSLKSITIPDSVTSIGDSAFSNCTSLTSITIPNGVTEIGYWAFCDCTSLESITIPDSVTEIRSGAFSNTAWYDNQPDGVVYAGKVLYTYKGEMPQNTTIAVKDGTKGISDIAFGDCTNLTSITIPDSVTVIGSFAFYGCISLTSITIPDSVTSIGEDAFKNCTSLTSVTIPDSVTSIGDDAFGYYYDDEYNEFKIDGFTITGYSDSAAESYANDNGFEFISLGEAPTTEPTEPATVITDKDTNVSVEGDIPEGIELNVESAEAVVENAVAAYNITLEKDGKAVQPDGKVTVKLPVPEGVDGSQCKVYYIDGDSKTDMNAVFVDGYLVFETDHFSVYAIVKTEKTSVLLGDVNGDGKVNIKDATTIQKSAASLVTLTDEQKKAADVNGDGKVNVNDATAIQKFVAGIETGFEIGK